MLGLIDGADPAGQALDVDGLLELSDVGLFQADDLLQVLPVQVIDAFQTSKDSLGLATELETKVNGLIHVLILLGGGGIGPYTEASQFNARAYVPVWMHGSSSI